MNIELVFLLHVLLSAVLGGIVGLEREWRQKPAGLRTHMLIAAAATTIFFLGDQILVDYTAKYDGNVLAPDPMRLLQSVALGISFIGAGTIIKNKTKGEPQNLTTAASVLFVAMVGCAVALELYITAVGLTVLSLVVTAGLRKIEVAFNTKKEESNAVPVL